MDEKDLLKQILDALTGKTSAAGPIPVTEKDFKEWSDRLRKQTEEMVKSQPKLKTFADVIKLNGVQLKDYSSALDDLTKQIDQAVESGDKKAIEEINLRKRIVEEAVMRQTASASVLNFGVGLTKILSTTILDGAINFVKGLQSGQDGVELYGNAAKAGAKATTEGLGMVGDIAGTAGSALSKLPGPIGLVGVGLSILGPIIGMIAKTAEKLSQEGLDLLQKEVQKTQKAFSDASASGALFANGMTGMRNAAYAAGLTTAQFAEVLKNQSANIAASGMGMTEGIKQLGQVKQLMRRSGIETGLMNLGYGFKEQAELVAETQANLARAGGGPATAQEVASQTEKYASNLRLISNLTGEDAKAKQKQVREQNQILAFQNKVAGMSKEQQAQIDLAMANMTEADKKALRDRIINNGVVIDKEAALAEATNAGAKAQNEAIYRLIQDGQANAETVAQVQAQYADSIRAGARANQEVAVAAQYSGSEAARSAAKSNLDYLNQATRVNQETVNQARKDLKDAKTTADPLTQSVNAIESSAQSMKLALEKELTPAITTFARQLINAAESVEDMLDRLGIKKKASSAAESPMTNSSGMNFNNFDVGGIASGPTSGYPVNLHGTEAVVPLPDNRSIPVSFEGSGLGELTSLIKDQINKQEEMIRVMSDNRDYTERLMHNMS